MKISTILDHIDSGHMALPEFQRGHEAKRIVAGPSPMPALRGDAHE